MISDKKKTKLNLDGYQRHIVFCGGDACCQEKLGEHLWQHLKSRLNEMGLADKGTAKVFRTKAKCLRVCVDGPIAVVYPEGTWYRCLDQAALDEVIEQHLLGGKPVEKYAFAHNHMMQASQEN
ncbi:MAG: (2Fe-2S) ferredoxin domain-containing protein [Oligoflexus sp.]